MRKQNRSSHRRSFLVLGVMLMIGAPTIAACTVDVAPPTPNPRLGKEKRVLFSSGCFSSVTMPVGATGRIDLQPAEESKPLPTDLSHKSTDTTVITIDTKSATSFDMHALKRGQSDIEVWNAGARYDALTFHVEPARAAKFQSEPAILAGGRTWLVVTDVFGACGTEECELFGHTFMKWSAEPASSFTFLEDSQNLAHYRASTTPGQGTLLGHEPSEGGELARQSVEIVDPATITGLSGTLTLPTEGETEPKPSPLPASVVAGNSFLIRVYGDRSGKAPVAISRHDIEWTVPTGLSLVPQGEPADVFAEKFSASDMTGSFTLTAKVALLAGMEQQFVVTVTPK